MRRDNRLTILVSEVEDILGCLCRYFKSELYSSNLIIPAEPKNGSLPYVSSRSDHISTGSPVICRALLSQLFSPRVSRTTEFSLHHVFYLPFEVFGLQFQSKFLAAGFELIYTSLHGTYLDSAILSPLARAYMRQRISQYVARSGRRSYSLLSTSVRVR